MPFTAPGEEERPDTGNAEDGERMGVTLKSAWLYDAATGFVHGWIPVEAVTVNQDSYY